MSSVTTGSEAGSSQSQKHKHDARLASSMQPPNSKQLLRSKTDDLNPVIISNALNLTLNHMVNVMERTLDVSTVIAAAPPFTTSVAPPSIITSSVEFLSTQLSSAPSQPSLASASSLEILDQVIRIISADDGGLTEMNYLQLLYSSLVHWKMSFVLHTLSLLLATTTSQ